MNSQLEPPIPQEVAFWNQSFLAYIIHLTIRRGGGFSGKEIEDLAVWWDSRKTIERQTSCPAYWQLSEYSFIETIRGISEDLANEFYEQLHPVAEPETVPF